MTQKEIIRRVADELGLKQTDVNDVFFAYWRIVFEKITGAKIFEDPEQRVMTDESYSISIPNIGKFIVKGRVFVPNKKKHDKAKEDQASVH